MKWVKPGVSKKTVTLGLNLSNFLYCRIMARYAISDIHGCCLTFKKLLFDTLKLQKTDELYLLGDYIDRGPDSKGVIDLILKLKEEDYQVQCLMGNHEMMMISLLDEGNYDKFNWRFQGGEETLKSFNTNYIGDIPDNYLSFIKNLPLFFELEDYFLVHAGFRFQKSGFLDDEMSMLWIRSWHYTIRPELLGGKVIIHGHTPTPKNEIEKMLEATPFLVLDIDAGCVYNNFHGMGYLCAFNMDDQTLVFEPNIDQS